MSKAKPKAMFCEKCGAKLQEDAIFCVKCGLSLDKKKSSAGKKPVEVVSTPVQPVQQVQSVSQPSFFQSNMKLLAIVGVVIVILAVVIPTAILLSGNDKDKFVGNWAGYQVGTSNSGTFTFNTDGTVYMVDASTGNTEHGTWDVYDGKLFTTVDGRTDAFTYKFSNNDNTVAATHVDESQFTIVLNKIIGK